MIEPLADLDIATGTVDPDIPVHVKCKPGKTASSAPFAPTPAAGTAAASSSTVPRAASASVATPTPANEPISALLQPAEAVSEQVDELDDELVLDPALRDEGGQSRQSSRPGTPSIKA